MKLINKEGNQKRKANETQTGKSNNTINWTSKYENYMTLQQKIKYLYQLKLRYVSPKYKQGNENQNVK